MLGESGPRAPPLRSRRSLVRARHRPLDGSRCKEGRQWRLPQAGARPVIAWRVQGRGSKIGLAAVEDEPDGLCDSTELSPSLIDAVLRPSAPRKRVPCLRARRRTDTELRAGHRRKNRPDRLHLGSILDSRRGRRREARCLAAGDVRLHPPLARSSSLAFVPFGRSRFCVCESGRGIEALRLADAAAKRGRRSPRLGLIVGSATGWR